MPCVCNCHFITLSQFKAGSCIGNIFLETRSRKILSDNICVSIFGSVSLGQTCYLSSPACLVENYLCLVLVGFGNSHACIGTACGNIFICCAVCSTHEINRNCCLLVRGSTYPDLLCSNRCCIVNIRVLCCYCRIDCGGCERSCKNELAVCASNYRKLIICKSIAVYVSFGKSIGHRLSYKLIGSIS